MESNLNYELAEGTNDMIQCCEAIKVQGYRGSWTRMLQREEPRAGRMSENLSCEGKGETHRNSILKTHDTIVMPTGGGRKDETVNEFNNPPMHTMFKSSKPTKKTRRSITRGV